MLARIKNWIPLEVLYASDLNNEFNNLLNNAIGLISPLTADLDVNNFFLLNMRFEVKTATQAASHAGRAYWQSTEGSLHIDTGTVIARVPAIGGLQSGRLVGAINPTAVAGATVYSSISLAGNLSLNTVTGVLSDSGGGTGGSGAAGILQVQVFS